MKLSEKLADWSIADIDCEQKIPEFIALAEKLETQNAELAAQVEYIKSHFNELIEVAQRCDSWESFPQKPLDRAAAAITSMPANCLRDIQAEAGRAGYLKCSEDFNLADAYCNGWASWQMADQYADRVKAGE